MSSDRTATIGGLNVHLVKKLLKYDHYSALLIGKHKFDIIRRSRFLFILRLLLKITASKSYN